MTESTDAQKDDAPETTEREDAHSQNQGNPESKNGETGTGEAARDEKTEIQQLNEELEELYGQIVGQWRRYLGHVSANVGGIYENAKTYSQEGNVYEFVPEEKQQRAMDWLAENGFKVPEWMLNYEVLSG